MTEFRPLDLPRTERERYQPATLPVIAGIEITTDEAGRFNLNALHRASSTGDHKAPNQWLRSKQAKELILELNNQTANSQSGHEALKVINGGAAPGTFAHELLAISYAGWISPAFQLEVNQTFIDYRTGRLQPVPRFDPAAALNDPATMRSLLLGYTEKVLALEDQIKEIQPKAEALDRIATADGSHCLTDAAKHLQIRPKDLMAHLQARRWIYRRTGGRHWVAYQDKIQSGLMEHKVTLVSRSDGSEKTVEQARVTAKGLARLAKEVGVPAVA